MKRIVAYTLLVLFFAGCSTTPPPTEPHVLITTSIGDIEIAVYEKQAPQSAHAFLALVDKGLYNNTSFYRVLNTSNQPSNAPQTELVQGGLWKTQYAKTAGLPIVHHENTQQTGITHKDGTISLARTDTGTASSEFFICVGNQPGLDFGGNNNADGQGYAAFGRVVKGLDVVHKIYRRNEYDQYFDPPIAIYNIERVR